jgi:predicted AAA+ superfamily ATPase
MFREERERFREMREQMKEMSLEADRRAQELNRKFQETDRKFQETDQKFQETAQRIKETDAQITRTSQEVGKLTSRIGQVIENMVRGRIIKKFRALGYDVTGCSPNKEFEVEELGIYGEVDLLLDDGPVGILIEVKTTLKIDDINEHIERIKNYRRYADAKGFGGNRHFIGAVAGAVAAKNVVDFAQKNGMYVITQSGEAFEIIPPPEGFIARKW